MKKTRVFIDGKEGTTGLKIHDRLKYIKDIELIALNEADRKNINKRKEALNSCDIAFLCLPDAAAIEAADMIENDNVILIDTSTAHRTEPGWTYGFPELGKEHTEKIINSKRIAVPGCHASGFIALIYPLIENNIISERAGLTTFSITGYSGGGRKMIAEYESCERDKKYGSPRQYAITQKHKHLKEMISVTGLNREPVFCPIVADFYSGMEVTVALFKEDLLNGNTVEDIKSIYKNKYNGKIVKYVENDDDNGFLEADYMAGFDNMIISVHGNDERILLTARYDNLGKGASGAAIECMNYKLGKDITDGLNIKECL
ncbi:MAG: N-acetyl-gamma-glutamyl-phosphate reductase [Clostridiales bacterium]|nr:N-acetyl-gamma-glutamyl-phosphate reductase [Clostridiales bacterium]